MKKAITGILCLIGFMMVHAQNGLYGPAGLYAPSYNAATTLYNSGNVVVGNAGNWFLAGNITSNNKGNNNAPNITGRNQSITFSGTGTYSNAATTAGQTGNVIDGYAAATASWTGSLLPIGNATTAYPVSIPSGTDVRVAWLDGSGSTQNTPVTGAVNSPNTTEYSPYIDAPLGLPSGTYTFAYPGFPSGSNSALLSSDNTSVNGTNGSTAYTLLANVAPFSTTATNTTATLPTTTATQVYFSTSNIPLPLNLVSFTAIAKGCNVNINWTTAAEYNIAYYALEAGSDGKSFSEISRINAENIAIGASYQYRYDNVGNKTIYYRLKSVASDGTFNYSKSIAVKGQCNVAPPITIAPNPTHNQFTIRGLKPGSLLVVADVNGRNLDEIAIKNEVQQIDISKYSNGIYFIKAIATNGAVNHLKVERN